MRPIFALIVFNKFVLAVDNTTENGLTRKIMSSFPTIGAQVGFWIYKEYPQEDIIYRERWRIYHLCQLSLYFLRY